MRLRFDSGSHYYSSVVATAAAADCTCLHGDVWRSCRSAHLYNLCARATSVVLVVCCGWLYSLTHLGTAALMKKRQRARWHITYEHLRYNYTAVTHSIAVLGNNPPPRCMEALWPADTQVIMSSESMASQGAWFPSQGLPPPLWASHIEIKST